MIDCKEAAYLADTMEFNPIPVTKRIGLKFHLVMCPHCAKYAKDSKAIDHILRYVKQHATVLSDQEKKLMVKKLQDQLSD